MDAKFILRADETVAAGAGGAGKCVVFIQNPIRNGTVYTEKIFCSNFFYSTIELW